MFCTRVFILAVSAVVLSNIPSSHGSEIINGKEVTPHSLPYMVLLVKDEPCCGGTLIDPKWVLTAAHCECFDKVWLGVHSISLSKEEKNSRQEIKVKKAYHHPDFNKAKKTNDLMLLQLEKSAKQTNTVKWLQLGTTVRDPTAGSSCLVAGWGKTEYNSPHLSDVLMSTNVTVIDRVECNSSKYYNHKPVITDNMICAGSDGKKPADTAAGDSGGPLLCNGALVGVTSFGLDKTGTKCPGVYAFLSPKQLTWVKDTMKNT